MFLYYIYKYYNLCINWFPTLHSHTFISSFVMMICSVHRLLNVWFYLNRCLTSLLWSKHWWWCSVPVVMVSCIPSASRVLMLLSQLERLNEEPKFSDNDAIRQITGKILHLIQTQGDLTHTHTHIHQKDAFIRWEYITFTYCIHNNTNI